MPGHDSLPRRSSWWKDRQGVAHLLQLPSVVHFPVRFLELDLGWLLASDLVAQVVNVCLDQGTLKQRHEGDDGRVETREAAGARAGDVGHLRTRVHADEDTTIQRAKILDVQFYRNRFPSALPAGSRSNSCLLTMTQMSMAL